MRKCTQQELVGSYAVVNNAVELIDENKNSVLER